MLTASKVIGSMVSISLLTLGVLGVSANALSLQLDCSDTSNTTVSFVAPGVSFVGTSANEIICGTVGDDVIDGGGGTDIIYGLDGNDKITTGAGNDEINGGAGDDAIKSGAGDDLIHSGDGDDEVDAGTGNDIVFAEAGDDNVDGEAGNDEVTLGEGDDYAEGGAGADKLWAGDGSDSLLGEDGNDWIDAGTGDDVLKLGPGDDYALGGPGSDMLFGDNGKDALNAGAGSDSLNGGAGADTVSGGSREGNDKDYCAKDPLDKQTNCFYDSKGPTIVSVAVINGTQLDTSVTSKVVTVRARIKDSGAGAEVIVLVFSRLNKDGAATGSEVHMMYSPGAWGCDQANPTEFVTWMASQTIGCRISGNENDGIYEFHTVVKRYTMPGTFQLNEVALKDAAGNQTNIHSAQIKVKKLAVNFKQIGGGDGVSPKLNSVSSLTKTVNTSSSSQVVTLRASVSDGLSGVKQVYLGFNGLSKPIDNGLSSQSVTFLFGDGEGWTHPCTDGHAPDPPLTGSLPSSHCRVSGTTNSQVLEMKIRLPAYSPVDTHQLSRVILEDFAGNTTDMLADVLKSKKLAINFKQVGPGDSTAPTIQSISMLTPSINTGAVAQIVTLKIRVKDNSSGVKSFNITFGRWRIGQLQPDWSNIQSTWEPSHSWDLNTNSAVIVEEGSCNQEKTHATEPTMASPGLGCRISGNAKDGIYEVKFWVPAHAASGQYRIFGIQTTDRANNLRFVSYGDLVKSKLNIGFTNG